MTDGIDDFIAAVARYLTDNLIIPPNGTVPATKEERISEWIRALEKLWNEHVDIRDIQGLWCDDITFCPEKCGWKDCPRNVLNIRDHSIPHSFSVGVPSDCPKEENDGD